MTAVEKIFEPDEMKLYQSGFPEKSKTKILAMEGIFFLKDLDSPLEINRQIVYRHRDSIRKSGGDPWKVMGLRKLWNHYIVRMVLFAPYYRKHLVLPYKQMPENWDANHIVKAKSGVYLLKAVTDLIPFTDHQIRYKAKKSKDSKAELGVWKDESLGLFLVDLAGFSPWLKKIWIKGPEN